MTRDDFRTEVFERDGHLCVVCHEPAVDAHHLLERRLWDDGGYHLNNGVALCAQHHLDAEATILTVEELRACAGITKILVPPHMEIDERYDKWGNVYLADGRRAPGELFYDESVQKVLKPHLLDFTPFVKYPRTLHLPWSLGVTDDDRVLKEIPFVGEEVVITEKMDGENTTMYRDHIHARSIDGKGHPSRSWVKNLHGKIAWEIPPGWRICGENLQAQHAIPYRDLPSFFLVFSIWDHNTCLSWDDTVEYADVLGLYTVPELWRGIWAGGDWQPVAVRSRAFSDECEGYVVRRAGSFSYRDFRSSVAKYVRANHVNETTQHWFAREVVPNRLTTT